MAKNDALLIPLLSRILDVPEAALHDDSNLMHHGMDSMRTMRAATGLLREGVAVTFSDFIDKRTVKAWCQVISAAGELGAVADVDAQRCDTSGFELATMQHAFWIGRNARQQLGGVSAHFYAELGGKTLDPKRLASALNRLIQRHDMLRLRIDEDARLHIAPDSPCKLQINDLRELSAELCHARLAALRQRYSHQQLDIANGETLMLALSQLPTGDSRLHIDLDMIAGDAASLRILLRELAYAYRQPDYALPPLRLSYRDYQQRWHEKHQHRREQDRSWWQTQLSRLATSPTLPLQPSEKTAPVTERRYLWLNPTQQQQLTTMSHQSGLSVPVVLATIFGECIGQWNDGAPFLLNLPVFSRDEEIDDADRLVGDFSSSVLLSVEPGSSANVIEQARQLQTQLHRALAHTAWSGVDVLRDLSRQQQSNARLAPVVFTSALALGDLFEPHVRATLGEPVWSVSQGPQVLIDAQATEYLNGIMLNWDVRTDRFAPGVIDAMFEGFQQQVHALLSDIACWQHPLPTPKPVTPWPPEVAEPAGAPTLLHCFFMQAEREPDAIALQWGEHGVLHYGELAQNALCIARFLQEQGIKTGDSVAISMGKGPEQVMAVLGTLAAGATYVPCGIDIPLVRREAVYRLANVALVLCDSRSAYQPIWPPGIPVFPLVQGLQALPLAASAEVDEQQAMYVIFTSGTTGEPKGVAVSHRAVANTVDGVDAHFTVTPRDCSITLSALDFDLSAYDIFSCLSRGARLAVVEEHQRRDAHEWLALIQRYDVSIISCVPALLEMILTAAEDAPLSSARLVMLGGDRIPVALAQRWWRCTAGAPFVGLGGMTEAAIHSTLFVLHADDPRWTTVPFGTPLPNMYCRIVDALGRDCPPWVAGELWVSGPGLALGYRNDPKRTAEKFVQHAGRRWYRSGDRARYWPDGTIDYLGRNDQQIKIRGHRIEPGEVEAALMRHPAIHRACVTVVEPVARQLCATLVTDENNSASVWQSGLQPLLPGYAIPEHYVVVPALRIHYRDYQCGQTAYNAALMQQAKAYWLARLTTLPAAPALPLAVRPETMANPRFQRKRYVLPAESWLRFMAQAQRHGITPSVALAAAYGEVLAFWSNQSALALNFTLFDRQPLHPDINRVVGDFASILLLGYETAQGSDFCQATMKLQQQVGEGLSHRQFSGVKALRELARYHGQSMATMSVVFTSVLGLEKDASLSEAFPRVNYTLTQTPQVWLDAKVSESQGCLLLEWDVVEALFPPGVIDSLFLPAMVEQMFAWYCHSLRALAGNDWLAPPIRDLPVAQRQMRCEANTSGGPMPNHRVLHSAFFCQAQQWPERPALWDSVNGYLSYGALREHALTVAAGLLHRGIHAGDCVALCLPSGRDRMVALLGILAAGAAYLPLNQAHPAARHAMLCRKRRVKAVICDNDLSFASPTYSLASLRDNAPLTAPIIPSDDTLAYVLFTSGSTGEPKGVMIEHRNVLNTLEAVCQQLDITAQDVFLTVSALDFDFSVFDLFAALSVGGLVVLAEDAPHHDADRWLTLMSTHGVSVWNSVPSLFDMLQTLACARQVTLPDLRIALLSWDWVKPDSGERLRTIAPSAQVFALGGATEAAIWSTIWPMSSPLPEGCYTVPYGFPLRNQRVRVVDALGNDTPDWVPGELWIGGLGGGARLLCGCALDGAALQR